MLPSLLSTRIALPCHPRQCQWLHLCIYTPQTPVPLCQQGKGDPCPEDSISLGARKGCYPAGSSHKRPAELLCYSMDKSPRERESPRGWSPPFCPALWACLGDGPACACRCCSSLSLALGDGARGGFRSARPGLLPFPMNYKPQLGHLTCQTVTQA